MLIVSQAFTPDPGSVGPSYTTVLDKGPLVPQELVEQLPQVHVLLHPQGVFTTTLLQQGFKGRYAILFYVLRYVSYII
jgi:hypothetical protein